jgi:hypothetical protein
MSDDFDFTCLSIWNADGPDLLVDNTPWAEDSVKIRAYFGELATHLVDHIRSSAFAVGCCAWLTHNDIINELSRLQYGCQIVCQKEDFLRPDSRSARGWKAQLHARYASLRCRINRHDCAAVAELPCLSTGMDDGYMQPIRCVGNHNSDKSPAFPRMHHKFVVLCDVTENQGREGWEDGYYQLAPVPFAVWTGSFNPTSNGTKSRENAVVIESRQIAAAYFREWYQMFALSEQLDWESDWCAPEYRIGT